MKVFNHPLRGEMFIIVCGGALLLIALGVAVAEARFLSRSANADGVVRSGQPAGPQACVAMVHFKTADGKEFVYQQYRKKGTSRGARLPQCTVGEIVPLAYDPGDPGRTVSVAGRGYEYAQNLLVVGGGLLWRGLWLRKQALKRASR